MHIPDRLIDALTSIAYGVVAAAGRLRVQNASTKWRTVRAEVGGKENPSHGNNASTGASTTR